MPRQKTASQTAQGVALARALGSLASGPRVFEDDWAARLVDPALWARFDGPLRRAVIVWLLDRWQPGTLGIVWARSRYVEDVLERALAASGQAQVQYVLLGAGLDSFALRRSDLAERVRVFEVDHEASQADKRARVIAASGTLPPNLTFVPVDFETQALDRALLEHGFRAEERTVFAWLGVTPYLTKAAVVDALGHIARLSAPGSELVLDYVHARTFKAPTAGARRAMAYTARRGEPILTGLDPAELSSVLEGVGLALVEDLDPEEQARRWFARGRPYGVGPCSWMHIARAVNAR
jgi:methyltransferase (TIGR00027 family)